MEKSWDKRGRWRVEQVKIIVGRHAQEFLLQVRSRRKQDNLLRLKKLKI